MASGLSTVVVLALCVFLVPSVTGLKDCEAYTDSYGTYHSKERCFLGYCCGTCLNRYCCSDSVYRLTEDAQDDCFEMSDSRSVGLAIPFGIAGFVVFVLIIICCCVCPCCCLYKTCRKTQPVIATSTYTTVVTSSPQQYPQQPMAPTGQPQSYQGASSYPAYQPVPVQPGYGSQPVPQGYRAQPMPTMPYQGQPFTPGPPPTYQEATGPLYPPNPMPYSQAAFSPGQPAYPLQPSVQPNAPPAQPDFLAQPAYNPDYVAPPPMTG